LSDGRQTCLLHLDWSLAVHVSAPDGNGWVFIETYAKPGTFTGGTDPVTQGPYWKPYTNELLQVKLDGSEVRRLAHHRSRPYDAYNYEPKLSVSHDSTKLVYSSNFGLQGVAEYADVYVIELGSSASGGGPTTGGGGTTTGGGG